MYTEQYRPKEDIYKKIRSDPWWTPEALHKVYERKGDVITK
uniref:Uncharacterized protein n=1 Tax=Anguilla anguilla TaxID=7936 RepID=A0A0E9V5Y6_ANGAN